MGIMDKMMDRMIINMSVAEKEDMMMQMMPIMMAGIDINTMMPIMLKDDVAGVPVAGISFGWIVNDIAVLYRRHF